MTRFMDWCPFVWAAGRAETKAARDSTGVTSLSFSLKPLPI